MVPFAGFALFTHQTGTRAVQNIGGIGNVTYLRAGGRLEDVLAFDTGPGNMLMDGISRLTMGKDYDVDGAAAAQGEVCRSLLLRMLEHPSTCCGPGGKTKHVAARHLYGPLLTDA